MLGGDTDIGGDTRGWRGPRDLLPCAMRMGYSR